MSVPANGPWPGCQSTARPNINDLQGGVTAGNIELLAALAFGGIIEHRLEIVSQSNPVGTRRCQEVGVHTS